MKPYEKKFKVDDFVYRLSIINYGIIVEMIGGKNHRVNFHNLSYDPFLSVDDWGTETVVEDVNAEINAWKFFDQLKKEIMCWVGAYKPKYFFFSATSKKKMDIYEKLLRRYAKGYNITRLNEQVWVYLIKDNTIG